MLNSKTSFNHINCHGFMIYRNRPLAKLNKAVKIADASDQRKAKSKTLSTVTVALRKDAKSFDKADSVFDEDAFS